VPRAGPPWPRGWRLSIARGFARSSRRGRTCWTAVWQAVSGGRGWGVDQGHAVDFMHMSPSLSAVSAASLACPVRMCMLGPLRSFFSFLAPFPHGTGEEGKGDEDPLPFISQYVPRVLCCGGKWVSPGAVLTSPTSAPLPLSARHLRHMYALHDLSLPASPFRKTLLQLQALDAAVTSVSADAPNAANCQR